MFISLDKYIILEINIEFSIFIHIVIREHDSI